MNNDTTNTPAGVSSQQDAIVVEAKTQTQPIRVLIVDDYPVIRRGMTMYLSLNKGIEVVGDAENGAVAIEKAAELNPDVVIMDLLMPVMDGGTATMHIKARCPHIEVLAVTAVSDERLMQALLAGVTGFLFKGSTDKKIDEAISVVAQGEPYVDSFYGDAFMCRHGHAANHQLTLRELSIWRMMIKGHSDEAIQEKLRISHKSYVIQADSLRDKLGCRNRLELTQSALRYGLITLDEVDLDLAIYSVTTATPKTSMAAEPT